MDLGPVEWAPRACTLPTSERPLRMAEFDDLFTTSVRGLDRTGPRGVRLALDPAPAVAARVADLAARETECCSFFTFAIVATGGELWLDITVPEGQTAVLDALVTRAEGASA